MFTLETVITGGLEVNLIYTHISPVIFESQIIRGKQYYPNKEQKLGLTFEAVFEILHCSRAVE